MRVSEVKILAINKNLIRLSIKGRVRGRVVQYSGKGAACFYMNTHTYTHLGFVLRWPVIHLTAPSFHLPPDCWRPLTRRPQSAEGPEEGPSILAAACFCLPCWINDAIGWHTHSHIISTRRLDRVGPCGKEALHLGRRPILQTLLECGEMP